MMIEMKTSEIAWSWKQTLIGSADDDIEEVYEGFVCFSFLLKTTGGEPRAVHRRIVVTQQSGIGSAVMMPQATKHRLNAVRVRVKRCTLSGQIDEKCGTLELSQNLALHNFLMEGRSAARTGG